MYSSIIISLLVAWLAINVSHSHPHDDEVTTQNPTTFTLGKEPSKDRVWNFAKGHFELVEPTDIKKTEILGSIVDRELRKRKKRSTISSKLNDPKLLEQAVYVDQYLWDIYVEKYGLADAETRLRTFINVMLNESQALYQQRS